MRSCRGVQTANNVNHIIKCVKLNPIKSMILEMKLVFKHQELRMFGLKLSKYDEF